MSKDKSSESSASHKKSVVTAVSPRPVSSLARHHSSSPRDRARDLSKNSSSLAVAGGHSSGDAPLLSPSHSSSGNTPRSQQKGTRDKEKEKYREDDLRKGSVSPRGSKREKENKHSDRGSAVHSPRGSKVVSPAVSKKISKERLRDDERRKSKLKDDESAQVKDKEKASEEKREKRDKKGKKDHREKSETEKSRGKDNRDRSDVPKKSDKKERSRREPVRRSSSEFILPKGRAALLSGDEDSSVGKKSTSSGSALGLVRHDRGARHSSALPAAFSADGETGDHPETDRRPWLRRTNSAEFRPALARTARTKKLSNDAKRLSNEVQRSLAESTKDLTKSTDQSSADWSLTEDSPTIAARFAARRSGEASPKIGRTAKAPARRSVRQSRSFEESRSHEEKIVTSSPLETTLTAAGSDARKSSNTSTSGVNATQSNKSTELSLAAAPSNSHREGDAVASMPALSHSTITDSFLSPRSEASPKLAVPKRIASSSSVRSSSGGDRERLAREFVEFLKHTRPSNTADEPVRTFSGGESKDTLTDLPLSSIQKNVSGPLSPGQQMRKSGGSVLLDMVLSTPRARLVKMRGSQLVNVRMMRLVMLPDADEEEKGALAREVAVSVSPGDRAIDIIWTVSGQFALAEWFVYGLYSDKRISDDVDIYQALQEGRISPDPEIGAPGSSTLHRSLPLAKLVKLDRRRSHKELLNEISALRSNVAELQSTVAEERSLRKEKEAELQRARVAIRKLSQRESTFQLEVESLRNEIRRLTDLRRESFASRRESDVDDSSMRRPSGKTEAEELRRTSASTPTSHATVAGSPWVLNMDEIKMITKLDDGATAHVFYGTYRSQDVAIKVMKVSPDEKRLEDFKKECELMASVRSPALVYFYGVVLEPKICLVLEYCAHGSLYNVLKDKTETIKWTLFFKIMTQSVSAIVCLHGWKPPIVHRDLKSHNLLIDDNWNTKLGDLGIARTVSPESEETLAQLRGTYSYVAPEIYHGEEFTALSDVYSLAVIFWEVVHRVITGVYHAPFVEEHKITHDFQVLLLASQGVRPTIPPSTPDSLIKLINRCWERLSWDRPTAAEVAAELEKIAQEYKKKTTAWDKLLKKRKGGLLKGFH